LANGIQYIPSVTLSNIADILCVCVCVTDEMRAVMCDRKRVMYGGLKHVTPHSSCSGKLNTSGFNPRPPPFVGCCQTETNMQTWYEPTDTVTT